MFWYILSKALKGSLSDFIFKWCIWMNAPLKLILRQFVKSESYLEMVYLFLAKIRVTKMTSPSLPRPFVSDEIIV